MTLRAGGLVGAGRTGRHWPAQCPHPVGGRPQPPGRAPGGARPGGCGRGTGEPRAAPSAGRNPPAGALLTARVNASPSRGAKPRGDFPRCQATLRPYDIGFDRPAPRPHRPHPPRPPRAPRSSAGWPAAGRAGAAGRNRGRSTTRAHPRTRRTTGTVRAYCRRLLPVSYPAMAAAIRTDRGGVKPGQEGGFGRGPAQLR